MLRTDSDPSPALQTTWAKALEHLEQHLGQAEVDSWFRDVRLLDLSEGIARLAVPSSLHADRIRRRFLPSLQTALAADHCELQVRPLGVEEILPETAALPAPPPLVPAQPDSTSDRSEETPDGCLFLNPDYTFDTYVVGPCNRFAHAAAQGVADRPAKAFNPLFLHGPVGVGKTHLMQAIAHHLLQVQSGLRIVFLSCESFVNDFIRALQKGDLESFRARYREADVLVVDDIQLLAHKGRTQEEFFHTFNHLHNAHKQVVLSSDSPPHEIPDLQERLVSRFKWGLIAEILAPCFETRVAILRTKAQRADLELPEEVAKYLAERVQGNVRELEGVLTRLKVEIQMDGCPADLALARRVLGANGHGAGARAIRMDDILDAVTRRFGVRVSDLQSRRRTQSIVLPRQVVMYLARELTNLSLEEIGRYLGGRDHTTVIYALGKIQDRLEVDGDFAAQIAHLQREIRSLAG